LVFIGVLSAMLLMLLFALVYPIFALPSSSSLTGWFSVFFGTIPQSLGALFIFPTVTYLVCFIHSTICVFAIIGFFWFFFLYFVVYIN